MPPRSIFDDVSFLFLLQLLYKICFKNSIKTDLSEYEFILLSFGEIDCRQDEGILKHCLKNNSSIKAISQSTARDYIDWVASELLDHKNKAIILGTPAPPRIQNHQDINLHEINFLRLSVIQSFNRALSAKCSEAGIKFADVLKLTSDNHGFNNGHWMIDNIHLKPKAIKEIFSHYLIQPRTE